MKGRKLVQFEAPVAAPTLFANTDKSAHLMDHNIGATLGLCALFLKSWMNSSHEPQVIPARKEMGNGFVQKVSTKDRNGKLVSLNIVLSQIEASSGEIDRFIQEITIINEKGYKEVIDLPKSRKKILGKYTKPVDYIETNEFTGRPYKATKQELVDIQPMQFVAGEKDEVVTYPEFMITLPGTKTRLVFNAKDQTLYISDELMSSHYDPSKHESSFGLPNPTDPRVVGNIFTLLEETHDCRLAELIPSLTVKQTIVDLRELNSSLASTLFKQFFTSKHFDVNNSEYATIVLRGITVQGKEDIMKFIDALNKAHVRHKGRKIPLHHEVVECVQAGKEIPARFTI